MAGRVASSVASNGSPAIAKKRLRGICYRYREWPSWRAGAHPAMIGEAKGIMSTTHFIVRAVVAANLRDKFDQWYATDHLPWAWRVFKCDKACAWSTVEQGVHYASAARAKS
jgi:hypothetical protein